MLQQRSMGPERTALPEGPASDSSDTHILNNVKPAAIAVGLDSMQGLQAARILRDRGVPVTGIARNPQHHACRTNACERVLFADTATQDVIDLLLKIGPEFDLKPVLVPCQDACVRLVSRNREALQRYYHVNLPEPEVVEQLIDKDAFYEYAKQQNLPIPDTYYLDTRADAEDAAAKLPYPCLLKPRARTVEWNKNTKLKVFKIENAEELLETFDRSRPWADLLVVQQWIAGDDTCLYSCNCYFDEDSRPLVTFVARKLRQWPPGVGSSCLGEEVRNDTVLNATLELFRNIGYRGLGYVEMKRDDRTGEHFIIEPNIGRPTGRSAIAEAGGVELLYTMYCDTLGLPLPTNLTQTYQGAKWIDLRHDLQSALYYWRRGELSLVDWWRSFRGRKGYAVWSWRDPKPFITDIRRAIGAAFSQGKGDA